MGRVAAARVRLLGAGNVLLVAQGLGRVGAQQVKLLLECRATIRRGDREKIAQRRLQSACHLW